MGAARRIIAEKYEVLGVLGEGGTGIVYDAVTKDGTKVALKVIHETLAGDRQIRGRFQREAAILRRLEGDHVCPILDFGEVAPREEGKPSLLYIALPKVEGDSLSDVLAKGPLEVSRVLDIMLEVLDGLSSAHAQGVIHRDLKPANVLLQDGKKVVVVDFGMSKIVTGAGMGTTNLTAHNMVFGTPEYMSPEQARGDDLDERCDVYAAGVMLYEMLTGSQPFTGDTPLNVLTAHLTSDLEPPSKRAPPHRVTPALESVVLHALARDRDQRYASAASLALAIEQARKSPDRAPSIKPAGSTSASPFAATLPVGADVPTPPTIDFTPNTPPAAVAPVDANAATMLSNVPPVTLAGSKPPSAPSSTKPAVEPKEPPKADRTWILLWVVVALLSIGVGVYFALRT